MSSQRRAPQIPDIPPFHNKPGGPLQARYAPNQTQYADMRSGQKQHVTQVKPVMAPPSTTTSQHHEEQRRIREQQHQQQKMQQRTAKPSSSSHRERGSSRTQAESEPRPSSRLANEKKKDYKDPPNIGPWKLGKLIGQGASGRVRHAVHTSTGLQAAVKIVPKQILATSRMSMRDVSAKQDKMTLGIEREIVIMKLIEHPNLLGLIDVYETSKELYLILEYVAGGELFDYLVSKGRLRSSEARSYFRQIIFGLHYCHSFNICHRDLKPENLLLDATKKIVKVADFGMAALQPSEKMLETSCGSPHYASPEIVSGKSYKGTASDIWSCGIILFALLCGRLPFDDPNIQTLLSKVRLGKFEMPDYLDPLAKDLIWKMLVIDPEQRLNMKEIMRHPWFTDHNNLSNCNPVTTSLDKLTGDRFDLEHLDTDILNNLKTLWPEYSQADIVSQLTSKGSNWQKTFYSLLVQHRENYSGDDEEDDEEEGELAVVTGHASPMKGNSLGLSLGINTASQVNKSTESSKERARPRRSFEGSSSSEENKVTSQLAVAAATAPSTSPRRPLLRANTHEPSPTVPVKTMQSSPLRATFDPPRSPQGPRSTPVERPSPTRGYSLDLPGTRIQMTSPAVKARPLPSPTQSPLRTRAVLVDGFGSAKHAQQTIKEVSPVDTTTLIRRATSPTNAETRNTAINITSIKITAPTTAPLTPSRNRMRSPSNAVDEATPKASEAHNNSNRSRPNSRSGGSRPSSSYGEGKAAPSIGVPQIGEDSMQQFFREIADELASIRVNGERPESLQLKLKQLERVAAEMRSPSRGASSSRRNHGEDDVMAQFDDAEDDMDYDDQYSVRSGTNSEASSLPYTPTSPLPPTLASPSLKTKPLSIFDRDSYNRGKSTVLANQASSPRTSSLFSTTSQQTTNSSNPPTLGKRRSLLLGRMKSERKQSSSAGSETSVKPSLAYERLQEAGAQVPNGHPTKLQQKNPGLGLDIGLNNLGTPFTGKSPAMSAYSGPPTPSTPGSSSLMSPSLNTSPKQSWFAGLFNWKPATSTLMSMENFSITHNETKRLLLNSGARVFVEDSENAGVFKCSMTEGKEFNSKPLRFRVEFQILPMSSAASPAFGSAPRSAMNSPALSAQHYATSVTLIQEKGSLTSFKQIYQSLKRNWTLDIPNSLTSNSPAPGYTVGLGVSGMGIMSPRTR
ncbi:hypothetical protein CBS101457_002093 [Exobasidium rhododendri]|nr:hypothetical protein CBS101457_002093 [Exobasidium rhododendri]